MVLSGESDLSESDLYNPAYVRSCGVGDLSMLGGFGEKHVVGNSIRDIYL